MRFVEPVLADDVAVYGGSFDPPHVGHALAVAYLRTVGFARVVVVPVFQHAFAKGLAPFEERLELCRRAFEPIDGVAVSAVESTLEPPSYTLHTLEQLAVELPGQRLRLVIGADVLHDAPRWHAFDRVVVLAPPFVLGRVGIAHADAPEPVLPAVSSTDVRRWLGSTDAADRSRLAQLVPAAVLARIRERGLYAPRTAPAAIA